MFYLTILVDKKKGDKPKKKRRPKIKLEEGLEKPEKKKRVVKRIKKENINGMMVDDEDNNDEDCSATKCLKPVGEYITNTSIKLIQPLVG